MTPVTEGKGWWVNLYQYLSIVLKCFFSRFLQNIAHILKDFITSTGWRFVSNQGEACNPWSKNIKKHQNKPSAIPIWFVDTKALCQQPQQCWSWLIRICTSQGKKRSYCDITGSQFYFTSTHHPWYFTSVFLLSFNCWKTFRSETKY